MTTRLHKSFWLRNGKCALLMQSLLISVLHAQDAHLELGDNSEHHPWNYCSDQSPPGLRSPAGGAGWGGAPTHRANTDGVGWRLSWSEFANFSALLSRVCFTAYFMVGSVKTLLNLMSSYGSANSTWEVDLLFLSCGWLEAIGPTIC